MKDATAGYSDEHMHAALEANLPNYAGPLLPPMKSLALSLLLAAQPSLRVLMCGRNSF